MARRVPPRTVAISPGDFTAAEAKREALRQVRWKFDLNPGQQEIAGDSHRFRIVCNGRRWGKSLMASYEAVEEASRAQGLVLLVAPTYKTAKNGVWLHLVQNLPARYRKVHQGELRIELRGGGTVQVGSVDQADNLRGMGTGMCGMVIDEAAFVPDYAVEAVLRPMLIDCQGWLLAISTPKGRSNWFYRYWLRGQSQDDHDRDYQSWQMPTWTNTSLPHIADEVDDLRNSMTEQVFRQEIAAEFVDDAGAVFRNVQLCELAKPPKGDGLPAVVPGRNYYAGIDFARSGADYTWITILGEEDDGGLETVWMERWGRLADEEQIDRLARVLRHFNPRRSIGEANSFGAVYAAWMASKYGIQVELFTTSGVSKGPLIQQAAACFEFGRIDIWPESHDLGRVLINELLSYERRQTEAGHVTYSAPEGFHDDGVISVALAIRAAEGEPGVAVEGGHLDGGPDAWLVKGWAAPGGIWVPGGYGRSW